MSTNFGQHQLHITHSPKNIFRQIFPPAILTCPKQCLSAYLEDYSQRPVSKKEQVHYLCCRSSGVGPKNSDSSLDSSLSLSIFKHLDNRSGRFLPGLAPEPADLTNSFAALVAFRIASELGSPHLRPLASATTPPHEGAAKTVGVGIKTMDLPERHTNPVGESAGDLPLDDHRVDTHSAALHGHEATNAVLSLR